MGIVLLFCFSGYLLPWDDLSFFATRVGISEIEKAPFVGMWLAGLVRGGPDVTIDTIGRFYVLHVTALPLAVLMLLGIHLFFIQIQGVSEPDSFAALRKRRNGIINFLPNSCLANYRSGCFSAHCWLLWQRPSSRARAGSRSLCLGARWY